jgi:2-C-methyl-D-erythritol 4-phosphate cytidylyltransferase/2-C-methyl-D-erythritol 2,4-cyclodiphosphate synthase
MEGPAAVVILVAAGAGLRLGGDDAKAFVRLGGRPMLSLVAERASAAAGVGALIVAVPPGREDEARRALADVDVPVTVVEGGATRQASVRAALAAVPDGVAIVVVHDAARPLATSELFTRVVRALEGALDGAVPVLPVPDTLLRVRGGDVVAAEPREELAAAQTPQAFRAGVLREAHAKAEAAGASFTDDASLVRWAGFTVGAVEGEAGNRKVTTSADLEDAARRVVEDDG